MTTVSISNLVRKTNPIMHHEAARRHHKQQYDLLGPKVTQALNLSVSVDYTKARADANEHQLSLSGDYWLLCVSDEYTIGVRSVYFVITDEFDVLYGVMNEDGQVHPWHRLQDSRVHLTQSCLDQLIEALKAM